MVETFPPVHLVSEMKLTFSLCGLWCGRPVVGWNWGLFKLDVTYLYTLLSFLLYILLIVLFYSRLDQSKSSVWPCWLRFISKATKSVSRWNGLRTSQSSKVARKTANSSPTTTTVISYFLCYKRNIRHNIRIVTRRFSEWQFVECWLSDIFGFTADWATLLSKLFFWVA